MPLTKCPICSTEFQVKAYKLKQLNPPCCNRFCAAKRTAILKFRPIEQRFWEKVNKTETCWIWTGSLTKNGYGEIGLGGREKGNIYAHRLSWQIHYGSIPEGKEVCHNCPNGDNPACIRPTHLFLGSHLQNMQDAVKKGRLDNRGAKNGMAKLTEEMVRQIRAIHAGGGRSMRSIAIAFGLSPGSARRIILRLDWKHVA